MFISINVVVFILYLIVRPSLTVYINNSTVDHMSRNLISVYKQGKKYFDIAFKSEFTESSVPFACLLDENVCAIFGIVSASSNELGIV